MDLNISQFALRCNTSNLLYDETIPNNYNERLKVNIHVISNTNLPTISSLLEKTQSTFHDEFSSVLINLTTAVKLKLFNGTIVKLFLDNTEDEFKLAVAIVIEDFSIFSEAVHPDTSIYILPVLFFNLTNGLEVIGSSLQCYLEIIKDYHKDNVSLASSLNVNTVKFAENITIACIHNPDYDSSSNYDYLLKSFFSKPRLLQVNDVICIHSKDDPYFWNNISHFSCSQFPIIYFKIISIEPSISHHPLLIHKDYSTLIQKSAVNSFVPCCISYLFEEPLFDVKQFLEFFGENALTIQEHIVPFLHSKENIKKLMKKLIPVFLVTGPVASSKSELCQAIASVLNIPHYTLNCNLLICDTATATRTHLDKVYQEICLFAPCMLILEYIDSIGLNIDGDQDSLMALIFKEFVNRLMYEVEDEKMVVIIGTALTSQSVWSNIHELFLHLFHIQAPTESERLMMIQTILKSYLVETTISVELLAKETIGMYYLDLKRYVDNAYESAFKRNFNGEISYTRYEISMKDFKNSLKKFEDSQKLALGTPKIPNVKWEDIGGLEDAKREIMDTILFPTRYPQLVEKGIYRSGILLYGPPGVGKTLLAKAIATECSFSFISVKGAELLNMYVGQSEENIREVFKKARKALPCIIFFDELDALAPSRGKNGDSGGVMDRVVSQLLSEMDGMEKQASLFFIGATNRPDLIDPALLRPGRFDKMIYLGINNANESRIKILKALTAKFNFADDCKMEEVVALCPLNMTGADLYSLASDAFFRRMKKLILSNPEECEQGNIDIVVEKEDFDDALKDVKLSVSAQELDKYEQIRNKYST